MRRVTKTNVEQVAVCGDMQAGSRAGGKPRTIEHFKKMAAAYAEGGNDTSSTTLKLEEHLSIENLPLIIIDPQHIALMPLHLTLGISVYLLRSGIEAVYSWNEKASAAKYADNLASTLRHSVGLSPTPYFSGGFEGRQCQRIGERLSLIFDLLSAYVSDKVRRDYNEACATWRRILPVLTRVNDESSAEMAAFRRDAASFVDNLKAAFEWTSITPKLHTLCCQAADFLEAFGSLGRYSEQGLEAWHGHYNQSSRLYTADTFFESRLSYVKKSAIARAPGNAAHNRRKRRSPATAGAHNATRLGEKRTRYGKDLANGPSATSQVCWDKQTAECRKWAADDLTARVLKIDAYRKREKLPPAG